MKSLWQAFSDKVHQPYFFALLFLSLIPLFPEYISFVLVILSAFFAYKDIKLRQHTLRVGTIGKLLMLFCAYQTLTCVISSHPIATLFVSLMWWFFLIAYLILVNTLIDKSRMKHFLLLLTAVAGTVGLIAFIQYQINQATGQNTGNLWRWLDKLIYPHLPIGIVELNYGSLRVYATYENPNVLAKYLVVVAPFVAAYNFIEKRTLYKLFSRVCLIFTFVGVIYSFSRGGYLAMILMGIALIVIHCRKKFLSILFYAVATLLLLPKEVMRRLFSIKSGINSSQSILEALSSSLNLSDIISNSDAEFAVGERWQIWFHSLDQIKERLFFGYGAGTQPTYEMFHALGIKAAHAHNIVLQLLLEGGIIALLLLGTIGFKVFKDGLMLLLSKHEEAFWIGFGTCGFALMFLIHGMVDYPFSTPKLVINFILILALVEQGYRLYPHKQRRCPKATKN